MLFRSLSGLRGGLPGLLWGAVPGLLLAFLWVKLFSGLLFPWYFSSEIASQPQWDVLSLALAHINAILVVLGPYFFWSIAIMAGLAGFWVGIGKGHNEQDIRQGYDARRGSKTFRRWHCWLLGPGAVLALGFWDRSLAYIFSGYAQSIAIMSILLSYLLFWLLKIGRAHV